MCRGRQRCQGSLIDPDYFSRLIKENSDTMLVISKMNMNAIWLNASVQHSTKQSLVSSNFHCWPTVLIVCEWQTGFDRNLCSGDIAVSEKTVHKLMKTSSGSNAAIWKAYPDSRVDLWDQNLVNGEYVIAFELNPGLGQSLKNLLPNVSSIQWTPMSGGIANKADVSDYMSKAVESLRYDKDT